MPRTNRDGNTIRRVLEYTLRRDLTNAEVASALDMNPATYSRHKDDEDFPSFEQLGTIASHFDLNATVLRYDFGYLTGNELRELTGILMTESGPEATTEGRKRRARTDIPPL